MTKEVVLRILSDGNIVMLYDDGVLNTLNIPGNKRRVVRASKVEFDESAQQWFIYDADVKGRRLCPEGFDLRRDAIAYELKMLSERLGSSEFVDKMFKED